MDNGRYAYFVLSIFVSLLLDSCSALRWSINVSEITHHPTFIDAINWLKENEVIVAVIFYRIPWGNAILRIDGMSRLRLWFLYILFSWWPEIFMLLVPTFFHSVSEIRLEYFRFFCKLPQTFLFVPRFVEFFEYFQPIAYVSHFNLRTLLCIEKDMQII